MKFVTTLVFDKSYYYISYARTLRTLLFVDVYSRLVFDPRFNARLDIVTRLKT